MGVIIDANRTGDAIGKKNDPDLDFLMKWIRKSGYLVIGGKLKMELSKPQEFKNFIAELQRAGRLEVIDDDKIEAEINWLRMNVKLFSNDNHIIALARLSGARILCTLDQKLIKDFCNRDIIDSPRGAVYRNKKTHAHLLRNNVQCQKCRTRKR
jgi:hypothetical protein